MAGKRHCPSSAIFAPSNSPFLAVKTVEYGLSKRGTGMQRKAMKRPTIVIRTVLAFLCFTDFFISFHFVFDFRIANSCLTVAELQIRPN